jgi:hypothetical protein
VWPAASALVAPWPLRPPSLPKTAAFGTVLLCASIPTLCLTGSTIPSLCILLSPLPPPADGARIIMSRASEDEEEDDEYDVEPEVVTIEGEYR